MIIRSCFGWFKRRLFGSIERPMKVWTGAFRGLHMTLDPKHQSQYILGLHEREVHRWLRPLCDGAATAIDIGAASGEYTLYFLKKTTLSKVFTFDPDDISREQFVNNMALNGLSESSRLQTSSKFVSSIASENTVTLDGLMVNMMLPCAIKMDVDGGEVDILKGATQLLATGKTRWLIETHSGELEQECEAILTQAGYKVTIIKNAWWRFFVPEQRPIEHNRWLVAFPNPTPPTAS